MGRLIYLSITQLLFAYSNAGFNSVYAFDGLIGMPLSAFIAISNVQGLLLSIDSDLQLWEIQ